MIQGSTEWKQARCGSLGASSLHEAICRTKSGWGAGRANLMARLIAERLTGVPLESYVSAAMAHGTMTEPEARIAYEFHRDVNVEEVAFVPHPAIIGSHCSPDGLIGEEGLVEFKCPNIATHIETLLGASIPEKYIVQVQWQMACTGRQWADWCSYDPRMPEEMRLFVRRIPRDDIHIKELEAYAREFLAELDDKLMKLRMYGRKAAA
jgi:hypothetical protein